MGSSAPWSLGLVRVDHADYCNYNSGGVVLYVGGNYNNRNRNYGPFYLNGNNSASNANSNIGSRHLVTRNMAQAFAHRLVKIYHQDTV